MKPIDKTKLVQAALEVLEPLSEMAYQCHAASHILVQSGRLGQCRVARGWCSGVGSQHSWVVLGMDCYAKDATIVDPTLWSYDDDVDGIWVGPNMGKHLPHGTGRIWDWGRPPVSNYTVKLEPSQPWSNEARFFLDLLGGLDRRGWGLLAHAPVQGWPSGEIIAAIADTFGPATVPVDILGMITNRNPGGIYLRVEGENTGGSNDRCV